MKFKYDGNSLKSGIYKLTNKANNRLYIGSTKEFKARWKQHTASLKHNKHSNKFLQADYNKCGDEVFVFEIVEITQGTKEERLLKEEFYINQFFGDGCYNLTTTAISPEGCHPKDPLQTSKRKSDGQYRRARDRIYKGLLKQIIDYKYKGNSLKSGIYTLTNKITNKIFIGSAKEFKSRWKQQAYSLRNNKHSNVLLQADFNLYGEEAFIFEVVEVVTGGKKERTEREQKYSNEQYLISEKEFYNYHYLYRFNKLDTSKYEQISEQRSVNAKTMWLNRAPEEKERILKTMADGRDLDCYKLVSASNKGKTISEETREKIRIAITGKPGPNLGKTFSIETRKKQSIAKLGKPGHKGIAGADNARSKAYDVKLIAPDGSIHGPIHGIGEFCREHNLNTSHLLLVMGGKRFVHKGWKIYNPSDPNTKHKRIYQKALKETIEKRAKTYNIQLLAPNGTIYGPITNIAEFSKQHSLTESSMYQLLNHKAKHHKGWTLIASAEDILNPLSVLTQPIASN